MPSHKSAGILLKIIILFTTKDPQPAARDRLAEAGGAALGVAGQRELAPSPLLPSAIRRGHGAGGTALGTGDPLGRGRVREAAAVAAQGTGASASRRGCVADPRRVNAAEERS